MITLYAIARAPFPPGPFPMGTGRGIGGRRLHTISEGRLCAVVERAQPRSSLDREAAAHFGRVLVALGDDATILPVRFGTVLPTTDAVSEMLAARQTQWCERLAELDGYVELDVRIQLAGDAAPPDTGSGRDYLLARAEAITARDRAVAAVRGAIGTGCHEFRELSSHQDTRIALLIPAGDCARVRSLLAAVASETGIRLRCSGPWPPFSFTTGAAAA